jgi:hypothetical protein
MNIYVNYIRDGRRLQFHNQLQWLSHVLSKRLLESITSNAGLVHADCLVIDLSLYNHVAQDGA